MSKRTNSAVMLFTYTSKRYKRYKHYTSESKESSTMLFSAITPYFTPLYALLFGILYAIFLCV